MGVKNAGLEFRKDAGAYGRVVYNTSAIIEATTIQGCVDGIWDITTIGAGGYDVTVANYDQSNYNDYSKAPNKPAILIKCSADASANNVAIKDVAGNTLYTFAANYSVNPRYIVLTLNTPTAGFYPWKLA